MSDIAHHHENVSESEPRLRFEFVGMMFAVAVGEIGIKCGLVAQYSAPTGNGKFEYALPATCHLLMAALIIAASWVGWSRSIASVSIRDVTSVFSGPFVVLVIDVLLVICYFIIVDTVELTFDDDARSFTVSPSAKGESFWILIMFCGYLFWDILTKVFIKPDKGKEDRYRFLKRGWVSILLVALSLIAWRLFRDLKDYWPVILADAALVSLLLLFRSLKDFLTAYLAKNDKSLPDDEFQKLRNRGMTIGSCFSIALILCAAATTYFACQL